jgi:hypothetical protein
MIILYKMYALYDTGVFLTSLLILISIVKVFMNKICSDNLKRNFLYSLTIDSTYFERMIYLLYVE